MTTPNLLLVNGNLRTLDPSRPWATALAAADGRLLCVGTDAEALEMRGSATEVIDLDGATATPGLVDSHIHPFRSALFSDGLDLMDARSLTEVKEAVADAARNARAGEWVTGFGLGYDLFGEAGIDGSLLDEAAGPVPALLQFVDLHTAIANRPALAAAGITGPRRFDENAEIVCVDGRPTGELREPGAVRLAMSAMPVPGHDEIYASTLESLRRYAEVGLTGMQTMDGDLERLDLLRELEANGDLSARVITPFWLKPTSERAEWEVFAGARDERGRRWRGRVAKFFIDGVIDSGTAWLFEADSEGEGLEPFWPDPSRYRDAVSFMAGHGFQCVTHACGDRAVREALDAYRGASRVAGVQHRVEHIETIQANDLPRFAAEGVTASMQAQHMMWLEPDRSDNWSRRLGAERCERAFPIRSLIESGAELTLGSDWPVARFDPREGMAAARLRRPPGHLDRDPYDDQAISGLEALQGYTSWPARTVGESDWGGALSVGSRADVTVFAADPVECPPDELIENPVLLTVVDGEVVHRGEV